MSGFEFTHKNAIKEFVYEITDYVAGESETPQEAADLAERVLEGITQQIQAADWAALVAESLRRRRS